jgi:hypothetical protein
MRLDERPGKKFAKGDLILLRRLDPQSDLHISAKQIGIIIDTQEEELGFEDDHWYYFNYTVFCENKIIYVTDHHIEKILNSSQNDKKL